MEVSRVGSRYIVQGSAEALHKLEQEGLGRTARDLAVIGGAEVAVAPEKAADFLRRAAELGLKATADGRVEVPEKGDLAKAEPVPAPDAKWDLELGPGILGARKLWEQGITGKGVGVAVIDTGVSPSRDLGNRIVGFQDMVNGRPDPYDDHGHGSHVSGTVAGDGSNSLGVLKGLAPEASIIGVKVLDGGGSGTFADVIAGIQWCIENKERYNIRVINLSLGAWVEESWRTDPVVQAVEAAVQNGILPCIAAGNSGPMSSTIDTPGNSPSSLTVGALDDRGTPYRWDDGVPFFSSRGPTPIDELPKPDVIAPGAGITAAVGEGYSRMSGTSMATPMAAGVAALLFSAHPSATPQQVKAALMDSADPLFGFSVKGQGKGVIDAPAALARLEKPGS